MKERHLFEVESYFVRISQLNHVKGHYFETCDMHVSNISNVYIMLLSACICKMYNLYEIIKMSTSLRWCMLDFSNLNPPPFLQLTANSHSDLPLSNQQLLDLMNSLNYSFFLLFRFQSDVGLNMEKKISCYFVAP